MSTTAKIPIRYCPLTTLGTPHAKILGISDHRPQKTRPTLPPDLRAPCPMESFFKISAVIYIKKLNFLTVFDNFVRSNAETFTRSGPKFIQRRCPLSFLKAAIRTIFPARANAGRTFGEHNSGTKNLFKQFSPQVEPLGEVLQAQGWHPGALAILLAEST
uniref:Uncharacterized protein n=1 Tax=Romanomermis culicivorax TaxID=13658 RepID=A0A915KFH5_ROMCU